MADLATTIAYALAVNTVLGALEALHKKEHPRKAALVSYLTRKREPERHVSNVKQVILETFFERFSGRQFLSLRFARFSLVFSVVMIAIQTLILFITNRDLFNS